MFVFLFCFELLAVTKYVPNFSSKKFYQPKLIIQRSIQYLSINVNSIEIFEFQSTSLLTDGFASSNAVAKQME
jgi:hypothetical protein